MPILGSGSVHLIGRAPKRPAPKSNAANAVCQKCLQTGHWTYQCKNSAAYQARPTRTQQLLNPKLKAKFLDPSELLPDDKEVKDKDEKGSGKKKGADPADTSSSGSDSTSSSSSSSSDDSSSTSSSSSSSESDSSTSSSSSSGSGSSSSSSSSGSSSSSSSSSSDSSSSDSGSSSSSGSGSDSEDSASSPEPKARRKGREGGAADPPKRGRGAGPDSGRQGVKREEVEDRGRWGEGDGARGTPSEDARGRAAGGPALPRKRSRGERGRSGSPEGRGERHGARREGDERRGRRRHG